MQKLVFITLMNYYPWGGSEELWQRTALLAAARGLSVEAHVFDSSHDHPKVNELIKAGVKVFFRKNALSVLDRALRRLKLNAINRFDKDNYWKARFTDKNSVYVISGGTTFDCLHFPSLFEHLIEKAYRFFYISQHHPEHGSIHFDQIKVAKSFFKAAEKIFFVSRRNLDVVERQLASEILNSEVVYNPVNIHAEELPIHDRPNDILKVAFVARLECANKGHDIFLQALSSDKWKERKILVSFYGKGPDKDYLELLAKHYNITHLVQFAGHVNDVREIWKENEFLVMCSIAEGTPLVLMEAMACGRGAVLTDVGGNAEWITDGYNGFLAPAPTPQLIDDAMERMWENRHRSAEIGRFAFETFTKKFPGDGVEFFYNKII